jgi:hypothetical protein
LDVANEIGELIKSRKKNEMLNVVVGVATDEVARLEQENARLREALRSMVDFAEHQMNPHQNDPSMFDDEDFGNLNSARKILNKND